MKHAHNSIRTTLRLIRRRHALVLGVGIGFGIIFYALGVVRVVAYANERVVVRYAAEQRYNKPVRIDFSRHVLGNLRYSLQEPVRGKWRAIRTLKTVSALEFIPDKPLIPGSQLHVKFENIQPVVDILSGTADSQVVTITVEHAPAVANIAPSLDSVSVAPETTLSLTLVSPNRHLRDLRLGEGIPVESKVPTSVDDMTFTWKPSRPLAQGAQYEAPVLDLKRDSEKTIATFRFKTVAEPQVASSHQGYLYSGQTLSLNFDTDMEQSDAIVRFGLLGKGSWKSPREYVFSPQSIELGKTYEYRVIAGARSVAGGRVTVDRVFYAQTPGQLYVAAASPTGTRVALNAPVRFSFDQPVSHDAAQAGFSISPRTEGTFSWSGNTMIFTPVGQSYQTTYNVSFAGGVPSVHGLSSRSFSHTYATIYQTTKLGVPYFAQIHSLSCEEASLRMALAYRGIAVSDDDVLARVGYNPQPRDVLTNTWQDPYREFVGNVDGKIGVTGWGVYAPPIASASQSFGRNAQAIVGGVSAAQIAGIILDGNPVVLWGVSGTSAVEDSWNTATSGVVRAPKNAHVRTVYGVDGTRDNPIGFYVHDPIRRMGSFYWTTAQLQANSRAGGGQAVIVY
ncbi:MAG: C39 family peptidase [Candidatus Saccharimonadales bacterium]|nr:C39 family peptidase [Candidatus Saccharibacteria bacterium]